MRFKDLTIGTTFEKSGAVLEIIEIPEPKYENTGRIICQCVSCDKNSNWFL